MSEAGIWAYLKWRLQVLKCCAFLMAMSCLDLRDLWYKITWVGPYDSFAFEAGSRGTLLPTALPVSVTLPSSLDRPELASDWPSYLSRCDNLTAFCFSGSTFFLNAMGANCAVGVGNDARVILQLVMTSNVRSDSMAWGSCQLLYDHRKPAICQQPIASNFLERYQMQPISVPREWEAQEDSHAEAELLRFLDLIARSHPRHKVICTGGFAYDKPGRYYPRVFGCASPNLFCAEYVGVYATESYRLQYDKAWLAAIDVVSFVGLQYKIRQNTINYFEMSEQSSMASTADDAPHATELSVIEITSNNFVSSGLLYVLMVIVDFLLLVSQMYTGLELMANELSPCCAKKMIKAKKKSARNNCAIPQVLSLRSTVALMTSCSEKKIFTVITQVISWGITIPSSVIWTWSLSSSAKLRAYLGSLRLWALILIGVNAIWDLVVFFERQAYAFARATYVTSFEVMAIGAICAYSLRTDVMAISETKFGVEHQRVNDVFSFAGFVAHGNTFNEDLEHLPNSRAELLKVLYLPLVNIVLYSILGVFVWLVVKLALYTVLNVPVVSRRLFSLKKKMGSLELATSQAPQHHQTGRKELMNSAYTHDPLGNVYRRVTLEKMFNIPMRARSLVRATLSMQKTVNSEVVLRPPVHLDFGVLVQDRIATARTGFGSIIRATMHLPPPSALKSSRVLTMATINATGMKELPPNQTTVAPENQPHQLTKRVNERPFAAACSARYLDKSRLSTRSHAHTYPERTTTSRSPTRLVLLSNGTIQGVLAWEEEEAASLVLSTQHAQRNSAAEE